jgi:hypothetical protein
MIVHNNYSNNLDLHLKIMVGGGVKLVLSNYIVMLERNIKYNNIIK